MFWANKWSTFAFKKIEPNFGPLIDPGVDNLSAKDKKDDAPNWLKPQLLWC